MKTTQHTQHSAPLDLALFEGRTPGDWIDCGEGTLLHPVTKRPVTTRVIEATGWGRIGEWYDYSNESDANFELLKAAPQLLSELQQLRTQRDALAGALRNLIDDASHMDLRISGKQDCERDSIRDARAALASLEA